MLPRTAAPALRVLLYAITACAAVVVHAQSPTGRTARTAPPGISARSFAGVMENNGALLGTAHGYRATFGAADVEYLPALGKKAKRAEPWHLHLTSIRRGETTLLDAARERAERTHDRRTVSYNWPGVIEHYETRADGLEQSFHFAAPLAGRGDLIVHVRVDTALPPVGDGKLAWLTATGNGVTLGDVTGIDAIGRRCRGTARHVEGGYELSLPAAFVDSAVYPLVLDPLIATATEALASADCDFPDVAYDAFTSTYCVAWTQFFANNVVGVVGSIFTANNLAFGYAFAVNQPGDEDSVRVCNIAGSGLFVMVWVNYTATGSSISGLAFEPVQAQATTVWTLYGPANVSMPVLSGEATQFDDDCLVAWIDDTYGLVGSTVAIDANLQVTATPLVQLAAGAPTEPAFSKQGGNPGLHLLCWIDRPTGLSGRLRAQVVDHDLNPIGAGVWVRSVAQDCGWPALDGDGFRFLIAWEEQEVANPSATDIRGRLLTVGPSGITSQGGVLDLVQYPNDLDFAADVAMLGDKFGLTYMGQAPGAPFHDDVYFRALSAGGAPIGAELRLDLTPGTAYRYEHTPRIISRRDGDPNTAADDGLVVFADQSATSGDSNVGLQAVEAMGPGGAIVDQGGGCGPGGLAVATGAFALGNTAFQFELFGAQPLAIPFLLLGLPGPRQTCGFCTLMAPLSCAFVANTAGYCSSTMNVPGDPGLVGVAVEFQFATFQVNYVGCLLAPGLAASNIVRAILDY